MDLDPNFRCLKTPKFSVFGNKNICARAKRGRNFWKNGVFNYRRLHFWRYLSHLHNFLESLFSTKIQIFFGHPSLILEIQLYCLKKLWIKWWLIEKFFTDMTHFGNFLFWVMELPPIVLLSLCATDSILFLFYATKHTYFKYFATFAAHREFSRYAISANPPTPTTLRSGCDRWKYRLVNFSLF